MINLFLVEFFTDFVNLILSAMVKLKTANNNKTVTNSLRLSKSVAGYDHQSTDVNLHQTF